MRINRQDTNGVKPLLQVGELGYDNWSGGGDIGRVYVGNGASNIALAKKSEVDAKVGANVDITAGTATKVTYDAKGLVTSGTNPTTLSGYGITDADTSAQVTTKINNAVAALVDASPTTLDTLNELAAALGDDPNFATTTATAIGLKADTSYVNTQLALKVDDTEIASVNLLRADKYLAAQNVVKMTYDINKKLIKVQYNNPTDIDYEVLSYTDGKLTNVAHYVSSVLKGNTVLTYVGGLLDDAPFIAV